MRKPPPPTVSDAAAFAVADSINNLATAINRFTDATKMDDPNDSPPVTSATYMDGSPIEPPRG